MPCSAISLYLPYLVNDSEIKARGPRLLGSDARAGAMQAHGQQAGGTHRVVFKIEVEPASGQSTLGGLSSGIINQWR